MKTAGSRLINEIVARITGTVHPLRIILFGSAARGQMGRNSDLDLLIIMRDGTHRRQTSRKIFRALRQAEPSWPGLKSRSRRVSDKGSTLRLAEVDRSD